MLTEKLTSIANAIREKGGTTEKLTLDAMPNAIAALSGGGGEDVVPNPLAYTGDISRLFQNNNFNWLLESYADRIQFNNVTNMSYIFNQTAPNNVILTNPPTGTDVNAISMFKNSNITFVENYFGELTIDNADSMFENYTGEKIPAITFSFNGSGNSVKGMFKQATKVKEIGDITRLNIGAGGHSDWFRNCEMLRSLPNFVNCSFNQLNISTYGYDYDLFSYCYSLRTIPNSLLVNIYDKYTSNNYMTRTFLQDCSLDEIVGFYPSPATLTSNRFQDTFTNCCRLKRIVFATQSDGTPYTVKWKNQTIDLSIYVGWAGFANADKYILNYNSGITADKEVIDKPTYDALKNDPDWWSKQFIYSRFNHDSAVEFINSLPDTSAYLATQSGATNTIKFKTNAGANTDGGSVNALTEEEIAVATAKGWTITYGV